MMRRSRVIALAAGTLVVGSSLRAQEPGDVRQRLAAAVAALDATETERAVELLQDLVTTAPPNAPREVMTTAQLRLAEAHWALQQRDSAEAHLRDAVRLDPSFVPDDGRFNPGLMGAYRAARLTTTAIRLRGPADTTLVPGRGALPVTVAVGAPGRVTLRLRPTQPGVRESIIATVDVEDVASVPIRIGAPAGVSLPAGTYGLEAEVTSGGATARHLLELEVEVLPVDTLPHAPPLAESRFRPESRIGAPSVVSIARGLGLGAVTVALPALVTNAELRGSRLQLGAAVIGVSIALGDILFARPETPVPANIDYNRSLREAWLADRDATAAENDRRRATAPLRIRTREGS